MASFKAAIPMTTPLAATKYMPLVRPKCVAMKPIVGGPAKPPMEPKVEISDKHPGPMAAAEA